ncbi:MAG: hypothetical protein LBV40_01225 [Methanomicrobiales archaeon]|jgi:hypothetical protein|nr:hypothetical protein [Methanomicrobiales archaeon]
MTLQDLQTDSYTLFVERQSFIRSHFFVQALFLLFIIFAWWGFIQQIVLGIPFGTNIASDNEMIFVWIMVGWLIPALLAIIRFDIEVTEAELRFQYAPFHLSPRIILRSSIVRIDVQHYHPLLKGWGIKYWRGVVSYTVSGNEGVCITYLSSDEKEKKIFLGSQSAFELERVLLRRKKG